MAQKAMICSLHISVTSSPSTGPCHKAPPLLAFFLIQQQDKLISYIGPLHLLVPVPEKLIIPSSNICSSENTFLTTNPNCFPVPIPNFSPSNNSVFMRSHIIIQNHLYVCICLFFKSLTTRIHSDLKCVEDFFNECIIFYSYLNIWTNLPRHLKTGIFFLYIYLCLVQHLSKFG